jgi:hemerythrin-like domain-containing protein
MDNLITTLSQSLAASPADPSVSLTPIAFLDREHQRQSVTYGILKVLADQPSAASARADASAILVSLTEHLPLHLKDEEEDLFPLLRSRAQPADRIDLVLRQLSGEHKADERLATELIGDLRRIAQGKPPADATRFRMNAHAFADFQERHLKWENAVVLPLAQERLSREDISELGRRMAERRAAVRSR